MPKSKAFRAVEDAGDCSSKIIIDRNRVLLKGKVVLTIHSLSVYVE